MIVNDFSKIPDMNTKVEYRVHVCTIYKLPNIAKLIKGLKGIECVFVIKPLIK